MLRFSLYRCFRSVSTASRALPDAIKQKPPFQRKRNQEDQFGLIGGRLAPQNERYDKYKLDDDRFFKGNIVEKEINAPPTKPKLKQITLPSTMNVKKRKKLEKQQVDFSKYQQTYGVDKRKVPVIIECKRSAFNHYEGQRYPSNLPLVSEHWDKSKHKGDWFIIKRLQKFPAAISDAETRQWEAFAHLLDYGIIQNIKRKLHFSTPTKIQFATLEDFDIPMHLFIAGETGSGKTIAFGAPILSELIKDKEKGINSKVIILTVSSFLRTQTTKMLRDLVADLKNAPKICEGKKNTVFKSVDDFDVLVATPSRAFTLLNSLPKPLSISTVVMDEADMILDESFVDSMTEFISVVPIRNSSIDPKSSNGARVIFSSATCPNELQDLAEGIVDSSYLTYIKSNELHRLLPNIEQKFLRITHPERLERLKELVEKELQATNNGRILIFCKDTNRVQYVSEQLKAAGVECYVIAKGKTTIPNDLRVIVATDAGSRGLDLPLVNHVVNYDFPRHMVDYVHRIGRVGRCNSSKHKSFVTSFVRSNLQISMKCARLNRPLQTIETDVAGIIKASRESRKEKFNDEATEAEATDKE
uniref:ATP-dependent RNA helicase n=1 Tax=Panagrolaimus davidi TaxID=227884 RepID=A0A914QNV8_9BILA